MTNWGDAPKRFRDLLVQTEVVDRRGEPLRGVPHGPAGLVHAEPEPAQAVGGEVPEAVVAEGLVAQLGGHRRHRLVGVGLDLPALQPGPEQPLAASGDGLGLERPQVLVALEGEVCALLALGLGEPRREVDPVLRRVVGDHVGAQAVHLGRAQARHRHEVERVRQVQRAPLREGGTDDAFHLLVGRHDAGARLHHLGRRQRKHRITRQKPAFHEVVAEAAHGVAVVLDRLGLLALGVESVHPQPARVHRDVAGALPVVGRGDVQQLFPLSLDVSLRVPAQCLVVHERFNQVRDPCGALRRGQPQHGVKRNRSNVPSQGHFGVIAP
jgi:hypothetical protein